jgi:hypothetical protein
VYVGNASGDLWTSREIWAAALAGGKTVPVNLPSSDEVRDFALHPGGDRLTVAAGRFEYDIYILEGFQMPRRRFGFF